MSKSTPTRLQPPRGTHDLIGEEQRRHRFVIETAREIAGRYGFEEWATPIFENTEVFARTLGETSDVVTKEMYTFPDRGGESLTLRPEGTAGVCRALVSNGLTQTLPQRVFYAGPMFRYERPQKGRFRQFHQIGVELFGPSPLTFPDGRLPSGVIADAEIIACGHDMLHHLGIGADVTLEINTLGDAVSREAHRAALVAYLRDFVSDLSDESRVRLEKNPLRILDSKDPRDQEIVARAPKITAHLSGEAQKFYDGVKKYLDVFGVPFKENPRIVRGLDYYSHTAFEFVTTRLGAQGTVMAGGRYEGLVREMGGPQVSGVGFAAGIERLAMLLAQAPAATAPAMVIAMGAGEIEEAGLKLLQALRRAGVAAEFSYHASLKRGLERADKIGALAAVLIGEDEVKNNTVIVRDLRRREQTAHGTLEDVIVQVRNLLAGGA